jgi:hypothetical protein
VQKRLSGRPLPDRQLLCLAAIVALRKRQIPTYITEEILNLLVQPRAWHVAQVLLPSLRVLQRGKYLRRWARRLREEGLSPEDAVIVSHASFGIDETAQTFGLEVILTTDYALKTHYEQRFPRISRRFEQMTCQLKEPYAGASLPRILRPEEVLPTLLG